MSSFLEMLLIPFQLEHSFVLLFKAPWVSGNDHAHVTEVYFRNPTCIISGSCFMNRLWKNTTHFAFLFFPPSHSLQSFLYDNQKPLAAVKPRRREIIFFIEIRLK